MSIRRKPDRERRGWKQGSPTESEISTAMEAVTSAHSRRIAIHRCVGDTEEEIVKEKIADEFLRRSDASTVRGGVRAYTEQQMVRKSRGRCVSRLCVTDGLLVDHQPSETVVDEIKFLMTVSPLSRRERFFVRGWMLGWSQKESARRWKAQFGDGDGKAISGVLRQALDSCTDSSIVSFEAFCRHTIYRKPGVRRQPTGETLCLQCHEPVTKGLGFGRYCSVGCCFAAQHDSSDGTENTE